MPPSISTSSVITSSSRSHRSQSYLHQLPFSSRRSSPPTSPSPASPPRRPPRTPPRVPSFPLPVRHRSDLTAHSSPPSLAPHTLRHLRTRSKHTLRFAHDPHHPQAPTSSSSLHHLSQLLLSSVPTHPPISLYLPYAPALHNAFLSVLSLLAEHPLPPSLHALLLPAAVYPHHTPPVTPPARDAVALDFLRAVAASPPRVPVELRVALSATYPSDRVHHLALLSSLGAMHSNISALLGLQPDESVTGHNPSLLKSPSELSDVITNTYVSTSPRRRRRRSLQRFTTASSNQTRASTSPPPPPTSPPVTPPRSRLAAVAHGLRERVAQPLRIKFARHSVHMVERSTWLSHIPHSRAGQEEYLRNLLGFVPYYLLELRSTSHRIVFIYVLETLLLGHECCLQDVSVSVRCMMWFILAQSTENQTLTMHAAFLAHRFGAGEKELLMCGNVELLGKLHRMFQAREPPSASASSSSLSSSVEDEEHEGKLSQCLASGKNDARRRPRVRMALHDATLAEDDDFDPLHEPIWHERRADREDGHGRHTATRGFGREMEMRAEMRRRAVTMSERRGSGRRFGGEMGMYEDLQRRDVEGSDDEEEEHEEKSDECSTSVESEDEDEFKRRRRRGTESLLFDPAVEPEVPDVMGLNALGGEDFDAGSDQLSDEERRDEDGEDRGGYGLGRGGSDGGGVGGGGLFEDVVTVDMEEVVEDEDSSWEELATGLSAKEVAMLLLSHQVAQGSSRNSRQCSKFANARPGPLMSEGLAQEMHGLFDESELMEVIGIIASFHMVQRWTVWFPYGARGLERKVRQFAHSGVGRALGVGDVGQRSSSKFSENLRLDCRSLRLPRHAVVDPVDAYEHV